MNRLAILDRDGVINRERGDHTWRREDFELLPNSLDAVKALHEQGYKFAIVSNQSGIGLGKYHHSDVTDLFEVVREAWGALGVSDFLALYCPHHPSNGRCLCRKPGSLLVERCVQHYNVDRASAFFVGDRERDVQAADNAGIEGILVESNADLYAALIEHGKIVG